MRTHHGRLFIFGFVILFSSSVASGQAWRDRWQQPETIMDSVGVKPGMVIGEAGAGDGYFTFKLSKRVGGHGRIYANDIVERGLRTIRERCKREGVDNILTIKGRVNDPLFPEGSLDMIIMVYVFHELEEPMAFLKNAVPSLKSGAPVVIVDRDPDRYGHEYGHFMKIKEVIKIIRQADFELIRVHTFLSRDNIYICRPRSYAVPIHPDE